MKFIAADDTTTKELQTWAGARTLVLAEFYFFTAGTEMERNLPGLYRSLLFEMLSRCPDLTPLVFPTQWQDFKADPGERIKSNEFTDAEIKTALEGLISAEGYGKYKFCFFIDGLDECKGHGTENGDMAREDMAKILVKWAAGEDAKICASSRPNREFCELFCYEKNPTIDLHLLNRPDISTYCINRYQDRIASKIIEPHMDLIQDIVQNSQGIFLWAFIVIDVLIRGIRFNYSPETLKASLKEIPQKLEDLYDNLRKDLNKTD
jgi:hypothetical protein